MVEERENDPQRGYKKVLDTVLSDYYEGVEFKGNL